MTLDDLLDLLPIEVKKLSSYLAVEDYENAANDALRETGWSFPITGTTSSDTSIMEYWIKYRSKRHLFFYLMSESAHKFKYDVISLNQRFEHYSKMIGLMDEEWVSFQKENPQLFIDLGESYQLFGSKIDAGFAYDECGNDISYSADIPVMVSPDGE